MENKTEHELLIDVFESFKRALIYEGVYRAELAAEFRNTGHLIDGHRRQELLAAHSQFVNQLFSDSERALSSGSPLQPLLANLLENLRTMKPKEQELP